MEELTVVQHGLAVVSGALVGFSLGLIGGGGSILAVPLLLYLVRYPSPHVVIGTTALAVSVNAYANLVPHAFAGHVRWRSAAIFSLVGVLGAVGGSILGKIVSGEKLLFLFALLMIAVAAMMLRLHPATRGESEHLDGVTIWKLTLVGLGAGILSGFFGIGGGFLIVPGLILATEMPMISAIGSSLFAVGTFGLATAASYALSGMVDWQVALEYLVGGILGGWLGERLATTLSRHRSTLNYMYSSVIFLVAIYMIYRNIQAVRIVA